MFETRQEIRKAAREKAIKKAVRKERDRILASWEELRGLSQEEARQKILEDDRASAVNGR